jgi:2-C-methyl-D-erythritol 4-phosphate cytidylyltransferase
MSVSAVIVAAGLSERLKAKERKPFLKVGRRSILESAICNFEKNPTVKRIIVVVHRNDLKRAKRLLGEFKKVKSIVIGGRERSDSVREGISKLLPHEKIVLIHDAARPLVSSSLIERVIAKTQKHGAVIPVIKITSTIKKVKGDFIDKTIKRKNLFLAQTPQGFKVDILKKVLKKSKEKKGNITDEAFLLERQGKRVKVIEGEISNIKITTQEDLELAKKLIK